MKRWIISAVDTIGTLLVEGAHSDIHDPTVRGHFERMLNGVSTLLAEHDMEHVFETLFDGQHPIVGRRISDRNSVLAFLSVVSSRLDSYMKHVPVTRVEFRIHSLVRDVRKLVEECVDALRP